MRISNLSALKDILVPSGAIGRVAASVLGPGAKPVRAIFFDKSEASNWALGWHQDRTIVVEERIEVPGFGPWTVKSNAVHVTPPYGVLEEMVTLRVHLDEVDAQNAPLLIAPGSHRFGRVGEPQIDALVQRCGSHACTAAAGDIWLYATLILHASERAALPRKRRVLQLDYSAAGLPGGLAWAGML